MSRRLMVAIAAVAVLGASTTAVAQNKKPEIRIVGGTVFKPGKYVKDNQRFKAAVVTVKSGKTVTWTNKTKTDPHTISLVSKLPKSFEDCEACGTYAEKHEFNEETGEPGVMVVDEGEEGFDTPDGDSFVIAPGNSGAPKTGTVKVSAPAGTTLKYFCAVHPWMQGKIKVK